MLPPAGFHTAESSIEVLSESIPPLYLFLFAVIMVASPSASSAQVSIGVSVRVGPPALPIYAQPLCPGPGYIWTPGYWAWGPAGYYWVPGTWVMAPEPGLLWTPGYWGWGGGVYMWHAGYWGSHVGFYGGVNYGFGYVGVGYEGGYWNHGVFLYNRAVNNVNVTVVHNVYNRTVIVRNQSRVSFNGGPGGIAARPTRDDEAAARDRHFQPTGMQMQHEHAAGNNRALLASENHGRPAIAATQRPGDFTHGAVKAREAGPAGRGAEDRSGNRSFPNENNGNRGAAENRNASRPAPNTSRPAPNNERQQQRPNNTPERQRQNQPQHQNQPRGQDNQHNSPNEERHDDRR